VLIGSKSGAWPDFASDNGLDTETPDWAVDHSCVLAAGKRRLRRRDIRHEERMERFGKEAVSGLRRGAAFRC
jgi:hypothetical protein